MWKGWDSRKVHERWQLCSVAFLTFKVLTLFLAHPPTRVTLHAEIHLQCVCVHYLHLHWWQSPGASQLVLSVALRHSLWLPHTKDVSERPSLHGLWTGGLAVWWQLQQSGERRLWVARAAVCHSCVSTGPRGPECCGKQEWRSVMCPPSLYMILLWLIV